MEQSSISTNVNIDFPKKVQPTTEKKVYKPRIPTKRTTAPEPSSHEFDPKGEIPVKI
jgi:hypothetical protein